DIDHMSYLLFIIVVIFCYIFFFFFQAEDGIRDDLVTGVQTCALPIFDARHGSAGRRSRTRDLRAGAMDPGRCHAASAAGERSARSEERRVGKGWRCWWG